MTKEVTKLSKFYYLISGRNGMRTHIFKLPIHWSALYSTTITGLAHFTTFYMYHIFKMYIHLFTVLNLCNNCIYLALFKIKGSYLPLTHGLTL
jgi:hypothetical protein